MKQVLFATLGLSLLGSSVFQSVSGESSPTILINPTQTETTTQITTPNGSGQIVLRSSSGSSSSGNAHSSASATAETGGVIMGPSSYYGVAPKSSAAQMAALRARALQQRQLRIAAARARIGQMQPPQNFVGGSGIGGGGGSVGGGIAGGARDNVVPWNNTTPAPIRNPAFNPSAPLALDTPVEQPFVTIPDRTNSDSPGITSIITKSTEPIRFVKSENELGARSLPIHEASGPVFDARDPLFEYQRGQAEKGNPESQYAMGLRYLTGNGVEQSDALARQWLEKASTGGNLRARAKLRELDAEKRDRSAL
jgi:TPR repeat protein